MLIKYCTFHLSNIQGSHLESHFQKFIPLHIMPRFIIKMSICHKYFFSIQNRPSIHVKTRSSIVTPDASRGQTGTNHHCLSSYLALSLTPVLFGTLVYNPDSQGYAQQLSWASVYCPSHPLFGFWNVIVDFWLLFERRDPLISCIQRYISCLRITCSIKYTAHQDS